MFATNYTNFHKYQTKIIITNSCNLSAFGGFVADKCNHPSFCDSREAKYQ